MTRARRRRFTRIARAPVHGSGAGTSSSQSQSQSEGQGWGRPAIGAMIVGMAASAAGAVLTAGIALHPAVPDSRLGQALSAPAASSARATESGARDPIGRDRRGHGGRLPLDAVDPAVLAELPRIRFDAVIAGLIAEESSTLRSTEAFELATDSVVYANDRETPIAVLPALDFLGEPTLVVPIERDGRWGRILTPARQSLPSAAGGLAPAQTSGWIPLRALESSHSTPHRIEVSISEQSLSILRGEVVEARFPVGVGTPSTPTPQNVTGYLQARYLDPNQGQSVHRVQLTSLHATQVDEPYGGDDGGLIGLHFAEDATGAVSHGCVRLGAEALAAVDALPLGTTISMLP